MPISTRWNNVIDTTEIEVTLPVNSYELERLGFPPSAEGWLKEQSKHLESLRSHVYLPLMTSALEACTTSKVALIKLEPEDTDTRHFSIDFGSDGRKVEEICPHVLDIG